MCSDWMSPQIAFSFIVKKWGGGYRHTNSSRLLMFKKRGMLAICLLLVLIIWCKDTKKVSNNITFLYFVEKQMIVMVKNDAFR